MRPVPELTEKCLALFEPGERRQGEALFRAGGIRLLRGSAEGAWGEWDEGDGGECRLEVVNHQLVPSCDCGKSSCRHLWGLLLAAARTGDLSSARKRNVKAAWASPGGEAPPSRPEHASKATEGRSSSPAPSSGDAGELRYEPLSSTTARRGFRKASPERQEQKERHRQASALRVNSMLEPQSLLFVWRLSEQPAVADHFLCELWRRETGSDGRSRFRAAAPGELAEVAEEDDRLLLSVLLNLGKPTSGRANALEISASALRGLGPVLRRSGSLRWLTEENGRPCLHRLQMETAMKARMLLSGACESPGRYGLTASLVVGDAYYDGGEWQAELPNGWLLVGNLLVQPESPRLVACLRELSNHPGAMPESAAARIVRHAQVAGAELDGDLPADLVGEVREGHPRGVLHVSTAEFKENGHEQLNVELGFDYGGQTELCHAQDKAQYITDGAGLVSRHFGEERRLADRLLELGFTRPPRRVGQEWQLVPARLDEAVR